MKAEMGGRINLTGMKAEMRKDQASSIHVIDSMDTWQWKLEDSILKKKIMVVDFTATWCGPCRITAPIFEELSRRHTNLVFVEVDVDEFPEIASEWQARAMPTFLFIKGGISVHKIVGANKEELERKADEFAKELSAIKLPESKAYHDHNQRHVAPVQ